MCALPLACGSYVWLFFVLDMSKRIGNDSAKDQPVSVEAPAIRAIITITSPQWLQSAVGDQTRQASENASKEVYEITADS